MQDVKEPEEQRQPARKALGYHSRTRELAHRRDPGRSHLGTRREPGQVGHQASQTEMGHEGA